MDIIEQVEEIVDACLPEKLKEAWERQRELKEIEEREGNVY